MQGKWDSNVQYLIDKADSSLLNVIDESVLAQLLAIGGDVSDFNNATDSLEAISNAIAGISGGTPNAFLAAVGGALDDAVASGAVTDVDTAMAYIKQIVTLLLDGTYGLSNLQVLIAALQTDLDNGTDGLGALKTLIDAIPTTAQRGTDNAALASVLGALDDAAAAGSATDVDTGMAYLKQIVTYTENPSGSTSNVTQFAGTIAYVSASAADDTGDGLSPANPKKTINAAIDVAGDYGAVIVRAGTYAENVVMDKTAQELWPEVGTIIAPSSGTPLTISGNYNKVWCPGGSLRLNPGANETGLAITGVWAYVSDVRVYCGSSADIGFYIGSAADNSQGDGSVLTNCRCSAPLIAAFKIQADKVKLDGCCTGGEPGDSSIGFWALPDASGVQDKLRIRDCGSQGHEAAGYQIDSGCANGAIEASYSGGGDGRWIDNGTDFTWPNFAFDDKVAHMVTFDGSGGASENLFEIVGAIQVLELYGHVDTVLSADIGNVYLDLYDGTNSVDLTDSPGPSFNSLPVGTYVHKIDDSDVEINILNSSQVRLYEDTTKAGRDPTFQVVGKEGVTSYMRMVYSGTGTSGAIHWHCRWKPLSDEGFMNSVWE